MSGGISLRIAEGDELDRLISIVESIEGEAVDVDAIIQLDMDRCSIVFSREPYDHHVAYFTFHANTKVIQMFRKWMDNRRKGYGSVTNEWMNLKNGR